MFPVIYKVRKNILTLRSIDAFIPVMILTDSNSD